MSAFGSGSRSEQDIQLEAGIAKHCLGSKIGDIHVCNFNNEICYTTTVPLQVASAPCMMLPTTHRHRAGDPGWVGWVRTHPGPPNVKNWVGPGGSNKNEIQLGGPFRKGKTGCYFRKIEEIFQEEI